MKIAVIAHNLRTGGGLTVGRNIVSTLIKIAPEHDYLMIVPEGCGYIPAEVTTGAKFVEVSYQSMFCRMVWEKRHFVQLLNNFSPDWLWGLGNLAYPAVKCRQSILMHNPHRINYHKGYRHSVSLPRRAIEAYLDWKLRSDLKFVDRVYCQTEIMRDGVCERFNFPIARTGLCPNAIKADFDRTEEVPPELKPYYKKKFIMFAPTRYYPAKNLEILIDTYVKHREKLVDTLCVMLVARDQGLGAERFVQRVRREQLGEQLLCIGSRPQELMPQFYFAADAMMLPTEMESFSGSYIEAMLFERPILTSNLGFATELCGNAAVYFDQQDPDDVCRAILQTKNSAALRSALVMSGKERLGNMPSWLEIVKGVLDTEGISHK